MQIDAHHVEGHQIGTYRHVIPLHAMVLQITEGTRKGLLIVGRVLLLTVGHPTVVVVRPKAIIEAIRRIPTEIPWIEGEGHRK